MDNKVRPVEKQLEAYNKQDIDLFMKNYAKDVVVEDGQGNVMMRGWDKMYESYQKMFEASPQLHCNLVSRIVLNDYILDEERVTGRMGSSEESHVVAVYQVEDGLITHVRFLR